MPHRVKDQQLETRTARSKAPEVERKSKNCADRVLSGLKAALDMAFADNKIPTHKAWRKVKPFENVGRARPPQC